MRIIPWVIYSRFLTAGMMLVVPGRQVRAVKNTNNMSAELDTSFVTAMAVRLK